jgi:DNA-binding FadR family transcriptional regulator
MQAQPHHAYVSVPGGTRSQTNRVVNDLGRTIISGRLAEGSLLPGDSDLIERYGVSRTVLREAFRTLSGKGLVHAKARIGTRVRPRSEWNLFDPSVLVWHAEQGFAPEFLMHLGEIRLALEPEGAALAAQRRSASQLEEMGEWAARMSDPGIGREDFVRADLGLHLAVAIAAGNPFFVSISTLIEVALDAMLSASSPIDDPQRFANSVRQHNAIVAAIASRDAEAARRSMRAVVQMGIDGVRHPFNGTAASSPA